MIFRQKILVTDHFKFDVSLFCLVLRCNDVTELSLKILSANDIMYFRLPTTLLLSTRLYNFFHKGGMLIFKKTLSELIIAYMLVGKIIYKLYFLFL